MSAIREEEFQSKKVEWSTWKKVLHYAMPYKRDLVTIMLCMTMSGITGCADAHVYGFCH